ncbi:hypothetical protein CB1_000724010 [Camelus ferus]|nr:hypothetical protein CB1_000724010 [Camelus ferus]
MHFTIAEGFIKATTVGQIPERFFPGKFDIWFQSLQIFHILVVAVAFVHFCEVSNLQEFHYGLEGGCTDNSFLGATPQGTGGTSEVIEDNGVRRVVVVPQAPEFHPGGHTVIHRSPHPPLPGFIPVPTMMPPPPRHMYSPVAGAGDMATQYMPQYPSSQVYGDVDAHSTHGRSNFRDERSSKTYERLQKKLKDRQGTQKDKVSSPPSSPQKCPSPINEHNGLIKGQNASGGNTGSVKNKSGKGKGGAQIDTEIEEHLEGTLLTCRYLKAPSDNGSKIQSFILEWDEGYGFKPKYDGEDLAYTVKNLRRSTKYKFKVPLSNGTDVTEYRLEWGGVEGSMQICYCGPGLSYELKGLSPATTYYCRVQALSIVGAGPFSEVVACVTPPSVPAVVTCLQEISDDEIENPNYSPSTCLAISWEKPCDHGSEILAYSIDFGEKQPLTVGKITSYIIDNLQPDTTYRIRIQALNSLGAGPFSHMIKLKTKPLPPDPPRLECVAFSHQNLKLKWGEGTPKTLSTDSVQYHLQMEDKNGSLQLNCEYRFRVCAIRQCQDPVGHQDLVGPYSTTVLFISQRTDPPASTNRDTVESTRTRGALSDELCAAVILVLFAFFSILIAFIIQYFVIK